MTEPSQSSLLTGTCALLDALTYIHIIRTYHPAAVSSTLVFWKEECLLMSAVLSHRNAFQCCITRALLDADFKWNMHKRQSSEAYVLWE